MIEVLNKEVGGVHYKNMKMQPIELIVKAKLNFIQGCIIKYVTRYKNKNGEEDIEKAIHNAQLAIDLYSNGPDDCVNEGYAYCKINKLSNLQSTIIISAMQNDYYKVIKYCYAILKKEYKNQG